MGSTTVQAIVLAAGGARRFGSPKGLADFEGRPLLRHVVDRLGTALTNLPDGAGVTASGITVVLGPDPAPLREALRGTSARIVINESWAEGLSSSLRLGLRSLPTKTSAVLIALGDQALIDSADYRRLLQIAASHPDRPVAARYQQTIGVPAIFPARYFGPLAALQGDRGASSLLKSDHQVLAIDMPNGRFDIDTPEQLATALTHCGSRAIDDLTT